VCPDLTQTTRSKTTAANSQKEVKMPREILWTDAEEIGIQLEEKFPGVDPLTVRFTDLHRYVTELEGFSDDPAKSNESRLEAIQMAWQEEFEDAQK
jgi:FeS assembly protein IscX